MAFLTCEANQTVGAIHPKAVPVILRPVYQGIGDPIRANY
jgi:putative SOS response-associated peptidase YedK